MTHSSDDSAPTTWEAENVEDKFKVLYRRFYPRVYRFLLERGFSSDESEELTQETFLRAYRSIGYLRENSRFVPWLFEIAANVYRNELRRRYSDKRSVPKTSLDTLMDVESTATYAAAEGMEAEDRAGSSALPSVAPAALDDVLSQERIRLLSSAVAELPSQMRSCLLLRVGQGLKYREVAEVMGISIETVKSHLFQARERLKLLLGEHFADTESS